MAASRTGNSKYLNARKQVIAEAKASGLTNCPGFDDNPCGIPLDYSMPREPNSAETDHIIPHAKGGADTADNLRVICRSCNSARNRKQTVPINQDLDRYRCLVAW